MNQDEVKEAVEMVSQAFSNREYAQALLLLKPLADAGIAEAIGMLGLAYQRGAGVEVDSEKALELLQKAVEMGDAIAAHNLALLYQQGMPGVEKNDVISRSYFELAAKMGLNMENFD